MYSGASNSNRDAPTEAPMFNSETGELEQMSSEETFYDGYDDDLMGDDEDRARLFKMTEKDREMELFIRAERRDTLKNRWKIRMKLLLRKREEDQLNKNDLEEKQIVGNTSTSTNSNMEIAELSVNDKCDKDTQKEDSEKFLKIFKKNEFEKPGTSTQKPCELDEDSDGTSDESSDIRSDESSDEINGFDLNSYHSNDEDYLQGNVSLPPTVTKNDLNSILLTRSKLELLIHHPSFEELTKGCLVKVSIGRKNGTTVYRLTNVETTVETIKTCLIGDVVTNKAFRIRHGHQTRIFRLEFISNNTVTKTDIIHWSFACENAQIRIPEKSEIQKKAKDIKEAVNYKPNNPVTPETIGYNLRPRSNPMNYAEKKKQLKEERDFAIIQNKMDLLKSLNQEIKDIDEKISEQIIACDYGESSSFYSNQKSDEDSNYEDLQNKDKEETKVNENEDNPSTSMSGIETDSADFGEPSTSAFHENSIASEPSTVDDNGSKTRISLDEYRKRRS